MNLIKKIYLLYIAIVCNFLLLCIFSTNNIYAQCGCTGAAIGGIVPTGGLTSSGVLLKDNFLVTTFYRYADGNEYYNGDVKTHNIRYKNYEVQYLGFVLGYGLTDDLTIETELGYFPYKKQEDYYNKTVTSKGFSHILVSAKYNFYRNLTDEFDFSAALGPIIPLWINEENTTQNIMPSTGAYGAAAQLFLHKGFKDDGLNFYLINRTSFNAKNNNHYQYGMSFISSFFASKNIFDDLTGILEIRNEYRLKDNYNDTTFNASGSSLFIISPKISYQISKFNISAMVDFPFYQYYNESQLANKISAAVSLSYIFKIDW